MSANTKNALMIAGMVISWSIYYAVSKVVVGATGSAFLAGFLLRASALVFLTLQLAADKNLKEIFRQGKTAHIWICKRLSQYRNSTAENRRPYGQPCKCHHI